MLLIDDDKTQIRKIYRVFQKGMGSYQQVYFSGEEPSKMGALRFLDTDPVSSSIRSPNGSTIFFSPS